MDYIRIKNLTFKRSGRKILDNLNLNIPQGSIIGVMGPSGCGKTTLLRIIGGYLKPASGQVIIDGVDINKLSRRALLNFRKNMGVLFQSGALFTDMNVYENIAFPLKEHYNLPKEVVEDLVQMKLECVGLRGARDLMPSELSGGMNRRVALARSIAIDPDLMMYDEPFTGQDPISKGVLMDLIKTINDNLRITSLVVSHDIPETLKLADYVYILANGKIIGKGDPKSLRSDSSPFVKQFLQGNKEGPVAFHYNAPPLKKSLGLN